jgi:hypothetical protein
MNPKSYLSALCFLIVSICVAKEPISSSRNLFDKGVEKAKGGLVVILGDSSSGVSTEEYSKLQTELQLKEKRIRDLEILLQRERDINKQNEMAMQALKDIAKRMGVKVIPNSSILGLKSDIFIVLDRCIVPPKLMDEQDFRNLEIRNSNVPHFLKYIRNYHDFLRSLNGRKIIILPEK